MKVSLYVTLGTFYITGTGAVAIPETDDRCGGLIGNCYDNGCEGNQTTLVCSNVGASSTSEYVL